MLHNIDQVRAHYQKIVANRAGDYDERLEPFLLDKRPEVRVLMSKMFDRLFPEKVPILVDVGCGTGFYFPLLHSHAENLHGIELCGPMVEQAQAMIRSKGLTNCDVRQASAYDLPFEDGTVDAVLSWDFLHHVPDIRKTAAEIARVLKPGGKYIAVEPNLLNISILVEHIRKPHEWGLLAKNQFSNSLVFRNYFDLSFSYDNTIITYLTSRTYGFWKVIDKFTSVRPLHYLSFRYVMCGRKRTSAS